jgi:hypothetical protein
VTRVATGIEVFDRPYLEEMLPKYSPISGERNG